MKLNRDARIFVAGHNGLVGSAIWRELRRQGFTELLVRGRSELDLLDFEKVRAFFAAERPEYIFMAAAKVGGIHANDSEPASFLYENLQIQNNIIHNAHLVRTRKLLFLGSSCIYPKFALQPMKEDYLLSGPLEPTNQWYAIAKIAGLKLCQAYRRQYGCNFISAMPTNLYGPNDNYYLETSHVLPALIRKFHEAKLRREPSVTCWGSGTPLRELLYSDDLARACVYLMETYNEEQFVNIGSGQEITVGQLAETVREIIGFNGEIIWDKTKPDGTPRKLMDSSRIFALGWKPEIDLKAGIRLAYQDFLNRCTSEKSQVQPGLASAAAR